MQRYRCHKVVEAAKIAEISEVANDKRGIVLVGEHPVWEFEAWFKKHQPVVGGYYVRYEDGYTSFSPAEAFEAGYTAITE